MNYAENQRIMQNSFPNREDFRKMIKLKISSPEDIRKFVGITRRFTSDIDLISGHRRVDGKSVMGVYSLNFKRDIQVEFIPKNNEKIEDLQQDLASVGLCL